MTRCQVNPPCTGMRADDDGTARARETRGEEEKVQECNETAASAELESRLESRRNLLTAPVLPRRDVDTSCWDTRAIIATALAARVFRCMGDPRFAPGRQANQGAGGGARNVLGQTTATSTMRAYRTRGTWQGARACCLGPPAVPAVVGRHKSSSLATYNRPYQTLRQCEPVLFSFPLRSSRT